MDYAKKIAKMDAHLKEHPGDYQTVIARLKVLSREYDYRNRKVAVRRLQKLSEIRRQLREEDECRRTK